MPAQSILIRCPHCQTKNRIPSQRLGQVGTCGRCGQTLPTIPLGPVTVTSSTFKAEVLESSLPVLVDFWAAWCGPCRMIAPDLERIARTYAGQLKVAKIDSDQNQDLSARFAVQAIPTLLVFRNGQLVERQTGALPYSQLENLAKRFIH
ncbi:thioredoxin TrxC [bacterium]|nr:thioredoxin TrxC [bacterium]